MEVSGTPVSGRQEKLRALLEAGREELTPVQLEEILRAVCVHAQELLAGEGACVTVYLPEADALELRACTGSLEPVEGSSFPVSDSVSGTALLEERPVLANDLPAMPVGEQARALPLEIHRAVSVPLPAWEGRLGTLVVVRGEDQEDFTERHQDLLSAYAVPAALALRGADRYQEEEQRAREEQGRRTRQEEYIRRLKALHDAELLVASETELEQLLQTVVDVARSLTRARYAALGVLNEEGDGLARFVTSGLSDEEEARYGAPPTGKGLLGAVTRERRPIRLSGLAESAREGSAKLPDAHHLPDSFLGVPISMGDRVFGNLYLTNKRGADEFTAEDQVLLEMLAAQAAVTIQKAELFRERDRLIERLETARRVRTRLSAYVNHDIRNALGGVALWAERLEGRVEGSEGAGELGEMAHKIRRGADHALRLVKDVLDLTRLEEGRLEVWPRQVRVTDLVDSALEGVRPQAEIKEIELEVETGDPELQIVADPDRVHQVVLNLLSNAVKFSPEGSTVKVTSLLSPEEPASAGGSSSVLITVEDEGPGIHPDDLDRIFGVYEQAREEGDRRKGLGVGLTLSRHLAELMGGSIEVSSEPGQGARFTLRLPVGKEPERRPGWIG